MPLKFNTDVLIGFFEDSYSFFGGMIGSLVGYFLPIKETVHILCIFFILDVLFGFLVSKKINGSKFQVRIIWENTLPKMLISFLVILTAHLLDKIAPLEIFTIRSFVGWFLCGMVLSSVWDNAYKLTKWGVLEKINEKLKNKLNDEK